MKHALFIAQDFAPSQALTKVATDGDWAPLIKKSTALGFGMERPINPTDAESTVRDRGVDIVIAGMSTPRENSKAEIAACFSALYRRIPFGFYADISEKIYCSAFANLRGKTSFVFLPNDTEKVKAQRFFPNAKIVISGNPVYEDFFFPKTTRKEVRAKMGLRDETFSILCPGGKNFTINIAHWAGVVEAVRDFRKSDFMLYFATHPGDHSPANFYKDLEKYSPIPARVITRKIIPTSELLSGTDLVIGSMSTIGVEAACHRIPVIDYVTELALEHHKEEVAQKWKSWGREAIIPVYGNPQKLLQVIKRLKRKDSSISLRMKGAQEKSYPIPKEHGEAVRIMRETILGYLQ